MLVSSYNNKAFDDLLTIQFKKSDTENQTFERIDDITKLVDAKSGETVGFNFHAASQIIDVKESGPIILSEAQVAALNEALKEVGFEDELEADTEPKLVIGYVKECEPHEDSDHLSVTQTEVDNGQVLQIVCGAKNIAKGQKVVVAKPGAIMPDGLVIWPGELRGVESNGMITSSTELGVDVPEAMRSGILVLEEDAEVGKEFTF